ncbi:hypothetical protein BH24ACT5_BH24ACT5_22080 [soil metagenome]
MNVPKLPESPAVRLAVFAAALALTFGAGAAVGAAIGPAPSDPVPHAAAADAGGHP